MHKFRKLDALISKKPISADIIGFDCTAIEAYMLKLAAIMILRLSSKARGHRSIVSSWWGYNANRRSIWKRRNKKDFGAKKRYRRKDS